MRALQLVLSRPHRPAEARVAYTAAERALAGAIRALAAAAADRPSPRVGAGRRAVGAWTDLLERIRLAALDEPGGCGFAGATRTATLSRTGRPTRPRASRATGSWTPCTT